MITNHIFNNAEYIASPNVGGFIVPRYVVMHYTAGYTTESAVRTFQSPSSKVSAHVIIGRDGKVVQMVPFNVRAWHAGPSSYQGYNGLNNHSIGIELVNIGYLKKTSNPEIFLDSYGKSINSSDVGDYIEAPEPRIGSGVYIWPTYTEKQLEALHEVYAAILAEYDILDVVSHQEIDTRGWKTDPGPAFPMNAFKVYLSARHEDYDTYTVTATILNIRGGPSTSFAIDGTLRRHDKITVKEWRGEWARISNNGWVYGGFLQKCQNK